MARAKRHTHKYYFGLKIGRDPVWACAIPSCNHYMPAHMAGSVENKFSICWQCGEEFILDSSLMKFMKPVCYECIGLGDIVREERVERDSVMKAFRQVPKVEKKEEVREMKTCECGKPADLGGICRECYKKLVSQS